MCLDWRLGFVVPATTRTVAFLLVTGSHKQDWLDVNNLSLSKPRKGKPASVLWVGRGRAQDLKTVQV